MRRAARPRIAIVGVWAAALLAAGGCGVAAQRSPQPIDIPTRSTTETPSIQATPCPAVAAPSPEPSSASASRSGGSGSSGSESGAPESPRSGPADLCNLSAGPARHP